MLKIILIFTSIFLVGCSSRIATIQDIVRVHASTGKVKIDGLLNEVQWQRVPEYNLSLSKDKQDEGMIFSDKGQVKFICDENYLYVGIIFDDGDIVAEGKTDNEHHYKMGDVCEIFLKSPAGYYWEIYVTPNGNKSFFFIPGRGRLGVPSCFDGFPNNMVFASDILGTLNNFTDNDEKWVCEIAIPREFDMRYLGLENVRLDSGWKILIARYNYSVHLGNRELSMFPQLSKTDFHLYEEYGVIELEGKR